MKKLPFVIFFSALLLSACGFFDGGLSPANISDKNWKNGISIQKDGKNAFVIKSDDPSKIQIPVGTKLKFSKSGERVVTEVVVTPPYINIYVDQALDPEGDGFPLKVSK